MLTFIHMYNKGIFICIRRVEISFKILETSGERRGREAVGFEGIF